MNIIRNRNNNLKADQAYTSMNAADSDQGKHQSSNGLDPAAVAELLSKLSFAVVSHVAFTGHSQELENYLKQKCYKLLFIGHPFAYASQPRSTATMSEKGVVKTEKSFPKINGSDVLNYLKDFVATLLFILRFKSRFHVYVGVDPLNALVGLILRRLKLVEVVVFYVIDYVPTRFKNPILNRLYHKLDKICVYNADCTWNLTSAMADARRRLGIKKNETKQITVPTGTHVDKTMWIPFEEIERTNIVFLSHLREGQGIDLILEALPDIIKEVPSVKLIVIGTGPLEEHFKKDVKEKNLEGNVLFLGYIEDHDEIEKIIMKCGVGLAPYVPDPNSFTWYADPGKPKVYLGCGVPVIITKVPEVAYLISKFGAGFAINYDKTELTCVLAKLLKDEKTHRQIRKKAIDFASMVTWEDVFLRAFKQTLPYLLNKKKPS